MAKLCTQVLPTGKTCARFALNGRPYCPAHRDPGIQQRMAYTRMLVESVPDMDLCSLALLLFETLQDLRARLAPPLHAEAIFAAAAQHLENCRSSQPSLTSCESDSYISRPMESDSYTGVFR
jgi:hypothetical protein